MVSGKSGKNKNFIFQGQEKVREYFEKPKEIENEDRDIGGLQKKRANVSLHNRHYFLHFQASKVKAGSE